MDEMNLSAYCASAIESSMSLNKFIDEVKPVDACQDHGEEATAQKLESAMAQLVEGIRNLGIVLWPVLPDAASALLNQLGIDAR